jgi:hypothetical protein
MPVVNRWCRLAFVSLGGALDGSTVQPHGIAEVAPPAVTIEENEESRRLREDVAILKAATTVLVGDFDPGNGCSSPSSTSSVHLTVLSDRVAPLVTWRRSAPSRRPPAIPCQGPLGAAHPGRLAARVE